VRPFIGILVTLIVLGCGAFAFVSNAMSECYAETPGFEDCLSDKRRDAIIILVATVAMWIGSLFYLFRKGPTT